MIQPDRNKMTGDATKQEAEVPTTVTVVNTDKPLFRPAVQPGTTANGAAPVSKKDSRNALIFSVLFLAVLIGVAFYLYKKKKK